MLDKVVVDTLFPDQAHVDSGTEQIHREYVLETVRGGRRYRGRTDRGRQRRRIAG
jgi:hypothetical protein